MGIAIAAVAALALVVAVLAVLAYQRANPTLPIETAPPVPTFTLGVQTETPRLRLRRLSRRSTAAPSDSSRRRPGTLWRAVAGACGSTPPVIERSNDGGASWTDVTPRYLGIAQVASLDGIVVDAVEAVSGVGAGCDTQALRSYTNGEFWEAFPDVLAGLALRRRSPIRLSCTSRRARSPRRARWRTACARGARRWRWSATGPRTSGAAARGRRCRGRMPRPSPSRAPTSSSATVGAGCAGFTLTRFAGGDPAAVSSAGCAAVTDAAAPAALVAYDGGVLVWSGDQLVTAH